MDSNQSSAEEDSCSSDAEDKLSKPPKKIRKLTIEEPAVPVGANVAAVDSRDDNCSQSESSVTEVTGPPVKIPKLDESATPWKESTSELISDETSQQSSASTAHEGEQVRSYDLVPVRLLPLRLLPFCLLTAPKGRFAY